jgi:uncharacterized protein YdaU (DUF1376 family)
MNYYRRYIGDYQRDTMHLSLVEHGAFTMLLDSYYAQGGDLPETDSVLFRLTRAISDDEKEAVLRVADQFFPVAENSRRRNARADRELAAAIPRIKSARENGAKGGRPSRLANLSATTNATKSATHPDSESEPESKAHQPPTSNHQPPSPSHQRENAHAGFEEFWERYPRKANRARALEQWNALAPNAKLRKAMLAALDQHRRSRQWSEPQFIPHASTWLMLSRWEDEVPPASPRDKRDAGHSLVDETAESWKRVAAALRGSKEARDEAKRDPISEQVIAEMGGWCALRGVLERDMPFKAKEFQGLYRAKIEEPES